MIKFQKYAIVNTVTGKKARVHYSIGCRIDGRKCVTIYAKDYGSALFDVLQGAADLKNDSDSYTDYFETTTARIFEENSYYAEAQKIAAAIEAERLQKKAAKIEKMRSARNLQTAA